MLCKKPYLSKQGMLFGCGQCIPCRVNRRREWAHRLMLEKKCHADTCFVTLTYADDHLPTSATGYPTLNRSHLQLWLKRFRAEISPLKIRFYACGEYGEKTWRPHYHLALFGFPMCTAGRTIRDVRTNRPKAWQCCVQCETVWRTWGKGDVELGELNEESAQYVAQYVTKKMTHKDDSRLLGRYPEFSQPSLKNGGIGSGFMKTVASAISEMSVDLVAEEGDVPSSLRHGSRIMPLGRYLRRKLREEMGLAPEAPESTLKKKEEEMLGLRVAARNSEDNPSLKGQYLKEMDGKIKQLEFRQRLYKKRDIL